MMISRRKIGLVAAVLFTVVNVGGLFYALRVGDANHAGVHVALLIGTYLVWRFVPGVRRHERADARLTAERLEYLQQSVDALAIEVERVGEAQRYAAKLEKAREQSPRPE